MLYVSLLRDWRGREPSDDPHADRSGVQYQEGSKSPLNIPWRATAG